MANTCAKSFVFFVNPFAAKTLYNTRRPIRFQADFRQNKVPLTFSSYRVIDAQLIK